VLAWLKLALLHGAGWLLSEGESLKKAFISLRMLEGKPGFFYGPDKEKGENEASA